MKLLVDNNISYRVALSLNKSVPGSGHVPDFNMDIDTEDSTIWDFAIQSEYIIITKNNDFEAMSRLFGCPPKVIQLICGNKSTLEILAILEKNNAMLKLFIDDNENCLMYLQ